jgi:hypothetical protein
LFAKARFARNKKDVRRAGNVSAVFFRLALPFCRHFVE